MNEYLHCYDKLWRRLGGAMRRCVRLSICGSEGSSDDSNDQSVTEGAAGYMDKGGVRVGKSWVGCEISRVPCFMRVLLQGIPAGRMRSKEEVGAVMSCMLGSCSLG